MLRRPYKKVKVRLTNFDKAQIYDYYDNHKGVVKQTRPKVLTFQGDVFGELHYWK